MKKFLFLVFLLMLVVPVKGLENDGTVVRKYKYYRLNKVLGPIVLKDEVSDKFPLIDENQYFDFTVSASMSGNVIINYTITAIKEADSTLPNNAVKVYLTSLNNGRETQVLAPTKISDLQVASSSNIGVPDGQFILFNSNFNKTESRSYRLRMWVASDYVLPSVSQTYKLRVNVYGNTEV